MLKWIVVLALIVASLPPEAIGQSKSDLVGTWRLVSAKDIATSGEVTDSYGPQPTALLTYTATGRMTAVIANDGRKLMSGPDRNAAPMGERAEAFSTFLAYAGTYSVTGKKVIHHVEVCSFQNWVSTDLVRVIQKMDEKRMILRTGPFSRGGVPIAYEELVWERVEDAADGR